jgi:hypothetical protein
MGITTFGRRATSATLAASVAVLAFTTLGAGPAHAVVPSQDGVVGGSSAPPAGTATASSSVATTATDRGTTGGTTGTNAPAGPFSNAPTENLYRIASHLVLRHKSVSIGVLVAPNIVITNSVEVSILFDTQRLTRNYDPAVGIRFAVNVDPLDGAKRRVNVTVNLREDAPSGPIRYVLPWVIDVEPLFDLTISPLGFIAYEPCDPIGQADPVIDWEDAEGGGHRVALGANAGRITTGFAGTWREIGVSSGLTAPDPHWFERDLPIDFGAPPVAGPPVLPGESHHFRKVEDGGDCDGRFDYDLTLSVRHYSLI